MRNQSLEVMKSELGGAEQVESKLGGAERRRNRRRKGCRRGSRGSQSPVEKERLLHRRVAADDVRSRDGEEGIDAVGLWIPFFFFVY